MITKAMLAKCQNEEMRAFCALPEDVRQAMVDNEQHAELLIQHNGNIPKWMPVTHNLTCNQERVYRLSPDTPCEQEYVEYDVERENSDIGALYAFKNGWRLVVAVTSERFDGILYRSKDGTATWRTSVDAAFGTPVKVRFHKEVTQ